MLNIDVIKAIAETGKRVWDSHCERFGLTKEMYGMQINLYGRPYTIVGINPRNLHGCVVKIEHHDLKHHKKHLYWISAEHAMACLVR